MMPATRLAVPDAEQSIAFQETATLSTATSAIQLIKPGCPVHQVPVQPVLADPAQRPAQMTEVASVSEFGMGIQQVGFDEPRRQRNGAATESAVAQTVAQVTDLKVDELPTVVFAAEATTRGKERLPVVATAGGEDLILGPADSSGDLRPLMIPVSEPTQAEGTTFQKHDDLVTLVATDADLRSVLRMIAEHHQLNLVVGPTVDGPVTVSLRGARLDEVLDAILGVAGFHWHQHDNLLYVTGSDAAALDPKVQGRRLQVYPLNYVAADDVEAVVTGLLSPIGKSFVTQSSDTEKLQTQELLIVEDNETGHSRISQYLAQVDVAPAQVLVEAHVLQIDLDDEQRRGVDLTGLARIAGARLTLQGDGFANREPEGPSLAFQIDGNDVDGLIEAIHANTSSRTLASPKVSVVNRQMAKVQIGQRLPYAVATTTQTATIQNVQFLDVGIVLEVTPVITDDRYILMTVLPKISGGRITESGFPEEDTTQVSTTVLMPDGSGLVIGGLIREVNEQSDAKVPGLGRIPVVNRLFNRHSAQSRRNELVVALVTHILDGPRPVRQRECLDLNEALPMHAAQELTVR